MLKNSVAGTLLMIALRFPAAAEPAAQDAYASRVVTPVHAAAQRMALAQRRDTPAELARAVALTVFFRSGSLDVNGDMLARIRLLGAVLREFPQLRVYLDAHCDRRGSNADNRRLSRARADVIAGVLRDAGIPAQRIHGNAWGETRARAGTGDAEGLLFDRRVDIQLSLDPEA